MHKLPGAEAGTDHTLSVACPVSSQPYSTVQFEAKVFSPFHFFCCFSFFWACVSSENVHIWTISEDAYVFRDCNRLPVVTCDDQRILCGVLGVRGCFHTVRAGYSINGYRYAPQCFHCLRLLAAFFFLLFNPAWHFLFQSYPSFYQKTWFGPRR